MIESLHKIIARLEQDMEDLLAARAKRRAPALSYARKGQGVSFKIAGLDKVQMGVGGDQRCPRGPGRRNRRCPV